MSVLEDVPGVEVPGPAEDAWVAGYEMGQLDAQLAARRVRETVGLTIRASNRDAAVTIARRHGYVLRVGAAAEPGFLWARFVPIG